MRDALLDVLLKRKEPRWGFGVSVVVAVGLHVAVVPGTEGLTVRPLSDRSAGSLAMSVAARPASSSAQRIELTVQEAKKPTPTKDPEPEPDPSGQVVSLPTPNPQKPLAADYLAEQAQKTDRETRARITGDTPTHTRAPQQAQDRAASNDDNAGARDRAVGSDADNGGPVGDGASTNGRALAWDSRDPGGAPEQMALAIPRVAASKAPDLPRSDDGEFPKGRPEGNEGKAAPDRAGVDGNSDHLRVVMGRAAASDDTGVGSGRAGVGRVGGGGAEGDIGHVAVPTLQQLSKMSGLPANDHLLAEEDDATSLNAFEWKHATYFNRIADSIRRVWAGGQVLGSSDPDGKVYGFEDRLTTVEVSIDADGNVVDLVLHEPSGAAPLDDEALRAFRVAGPFPNPPPALFRGGDRYSFKFGFAVNYNRSHVDLNWRPY